MRYNTTLWVVLILGSASDNIARKQSAIIESQKKYSSILNASFLAILLCRTDGRIVEVNNTATSMFRAQSKQKILDCKNIRKLLVTELLEKDLESQLDYLLTEKNHSIEWKAVHLDSNTEFYIQLAVQQMQLADSDYLIVNILDITSRKDAERQLLQAQKMEAIGTLAGGIAHDFNNILSAILGYSEMAQDQVPKNTTLYGDIDKVVIAANRAKDLVSHILTFSRKETSALSPLLPILPIKEALQLLRSSIPATIVIQQSLDQACGMIMADSTQLHQIVMNLCTNSFHAMEERGGTLFVRLDRTELTKRDLQEFSLQPGTYVRLTVCDTGPGIEPKNLKKIFDPYFTTKEVGKGTGMGLSVVHGIVEQHGGMISVSSTLGKGTVFNVFFPQLTETVDLKDPTTGSPPTGNEQMLAELGKKLLERLGYSVTTTTSSHEALEIIKTHPQQYDIVITDQTMPGMTGVELAREIITINPELPIILCTGYSRSISEKNAFEKGFHGFIMKPLSKNDIAQLVRQVLDGKKRI